MSPGMASALREGAHTLRAEATRNEYRAKALRDEAATYDERAKGLRDTAALMDQAVAEDGAR